MQKEEDDRKVILEVDLGFGDSGKGTVVDAVVRNEKARTVVRYNGGAQAAHNVITTDGKHHTFAQFGSGMLIPGNRTHLSKFMLIEPLAMIFEEEHLQEIGILGSFERTTIDERAVIISPFHRSVNRLREMARGDGKHGSCGMGIGETMSDAINYPECIIRAEDFFDLTKLRQKLKSIQDLKNYHLKDLLPLISDSESKQKELNILQSSHSVDGFMWWYKNFKEKACIVPSLHLASILSEGTVVFEGSQGVLLDEWNGFHPYTTWSTTTLANAYTLLKEVSYDGEIERLGVMRAYATRHGPGPFVTEDTDLTNTIPDSHNKNNPWQSGFRVGWLDFVILRYAISLVGNLDSLAVTCVDRLKEIENWKICDGYHCDNSVQNLDKYFSLEKKEVNGSVIRDIKVNPIHDLERQQKLTDLLLTCHPELTEVSNQSIGDYLKLIEEKLRIPISVVSSGPTARDKEFLDVLVR